MGEAKQKSIEQEKFDGELAPCKQEVEDALKRHGFSLSSCLRYTEQGIFSVPVYVKLQGAKESITARQ